MSSALALTLLLVALSDWLDLVFDWAGLVGAVGTSMRPFRFIAPMPRLNGSAGCWRDSLRRIEDLGFSTVSVSDHFTQGWVMEPTIAMAAAADATARLRVLSLVLGNDYRHPVMVHKAMATLDVLSEGRVEVGLGAGWLLSDYRAAHVPYDPAGVRIDRLEESLQIMKGLFRSPPLSFSGRHYQITGLEGLPKPVQQPGPPLLVGGGRRRVLSVAGRHADIIGINPSLQDGVVSPEAILDMTPERVAQKVTWAREAAEAAGRSIADLEFQASMLICRISSASGPAAAAVSSLAARANVDPEVLAQSPVALAGSIEQCIERLIENRERFGISYVNLGGNVDAVGPIVQRLAGC
ncbi:MAG TPA: TIGR03621 family F420-dependent LLM class oxidoreductase [Actinomycetes bacterium]|nr:TIGR03621 family F420-dependent LLM class oxidoreductase [Actinomycetes bacterium]